MSEIITVQVGQCGNQVGSEFWPEVLREYRSTDGCYGGDIGGFLYRDRSLGVRNDDIRARALLIDMEESVVDRLEKGPSRNLFNEDNILKKSGGSGNNWSIGFHEHGDEQVRTIDDMLRRSAEKCDRLHGFLLLYSLSGGTGSGLGSRILASLSDHYYKLQRFVCCVHPGTQYDVVNAPYNIGLTLSNLSEHASCVFPVDNEALSNIVDYHKVSRYMASASASSKVDTYHSMNRVICKMLLELTSGARLPGSFNLDMSDLTTNLVPFPDLNFVSSGFSPIASAQLRRTTAIPPKICDDAVCEAVSGRNQLLRINPVKGTLLSGCLHGRGDLSLTTIKQLSRRVRSEWRRQAVWLSCVRYSLCSVPPPDNPFSLLCLINSTAMAALFLETYINFKRLYSKKAYVHHYFNASDSDYDFNSTLENLMNVVQTYRSKDVPG